LDKLSVKDIVISASFKIQIPKLICFFYNWSDLVVLILGYAVGVRGNGDGDS